MDITKIDGVNWVQKTIPTVSGDIKVVGMSVRAMRAALQDADPDDLVCYLAEMTEESRKADLLIGAIGAVGIGSNCGTVFLMGPEAANAMKKTGII